MATEIEVIQDALLACKTVMWRQSRANGSRLIQVTGFTQHEGRPYATTKRDGSINLNAVGPDSFFVLSPSFP